MSNYLYIDNVNLNRHETTVIKGNVITDCYGPVVCGIKVNSAYNIRIRENKVLRMRSQTLSVGYLVNSTNDTLISYNVASRCGFGFVFKEIALVDVYNITAHNCDYCVWTDSNGNYNNVSFSAYPDWKNYKNNIGFYTTGSAVVSINYSYYYGIGTFFSGTGTINQGTSVKNEQILYLDESNDDLTPDHISVLVGSGIDEPYGYSFPSIGGIQSQITDETTAKINYYYELLDNSFWDVSNAQAGEVALIKAFQSRILSNSELAETQVESDFYIKTANSLTYFSEIFPTSSRYQNSSKYKKRVMDLWYSSQNVGTATAYERAIGGYNLLPSFYRKMVEYYNGWIIANSAINVDNWLIGQLAQQYGIGIDVLGTSTITEESSGECFNNTMNCIADIGPVYWNLHNEVEPDGYITFCTYYNNFEDCELTNLVYNDDDHISCLTEQSSAEILTPLISTRNMLPLSGSSQAELSTFDRINSEIIDRIMYYRVGNSLGTMGDWSQIDRPIGELLDIGENLFIQFKIIIKYILRAGDYEFISLGMRKYISTDVIETSGYPFISSITLIVT